MVRTNTPVAYARKSDRRTSHDAAGTLTGEMLSGIQKVVVAILAKYGPMTDEALVRKYAEVRANNSRIPKTTDSSLRTRRSELVAAGLVFERGVVKTESGRMATLWGV